MKLLQFIKGIVLLGLILSGSCKIIAQQLPMDPDVTVGKLKNGFTYYIRKNTTQKKRVVLYLVNKAGSILETDEQLGLAHLMEHMSFNGSTHFPDNTLVDFLQKAGVRFGADLNAYTSYDQTVYQLPLPIDNPEMLNTGLQVIRDWAQEATLDTAKINKERGVVLEEKRLRSGSQQRINDQVFPYLVNHSRYAYRNPIGTEQVLKNFTRPTLLSFYRDWYRPDLQAIIVVGDIDVKKIEEKINKLFSDLKNPQDEKERPGYAIELKGVNQFAVVADKELQATSMQVVIKFPHKNLTSYKDYLEYVKTNIFNMVVAERLQSVSRKNSGNYIFATAGLSAIVGNIDAFNAVISVKTGELEKGFNAFWTEINKIKTQGFTAEEVDAAKVRYLTLVQTVAAESDKKRSEQYAQEYVRHFIQEEASTGMAKEADLTDAYLPAISVGSLNQMAKQRITNTNRDVIITGNDGEKFPDEQQINQWFDKFDNTDVASTGTIDKKNATDSSTLRPLIANLPDKGKIVSTSKVKELDITEFRLSNGVRVIVKPTNFANDEISFTAFSPGGSSIYSDADFQSATNAATLIAGGGVGNFDMEGLRKKLNGKNVSVFPYIGERTEGISGGCRGKDLETALQLTHLYFTQPRKDTAEFNATMNRLRSSYASPVNTPEKMFSDTLSAVLANYNQRRMSPGIHEIEQINLDRAFEIYKERFSDASDFTFIMVGNIDPVKLKPLLELYLGSLPSTGRKESARDLGIRIPKRIIEKTLYSGASDKATVQLVISGDYIFNRNNNIKLEAIRQILAFHMLERLREKESGVYSPQVSLQQAKEPNSSYAFFISFGCSPDNVERLIAAAWDEISKLKKNGPSDDDLGKFVSEQKVVIKNQVETNGFWVGYLKNQYQQGESPLDILSYDADLDKLDKSGLKSDMGTYLSKDNYIRVVLLPENRKK